MFVEVNGIKICYNRGGEGQPVFLIHGFGAKKESWVAQFSPLSKHFDVVRMDNRGAGKSERVEEPYSMETLADDVKGLMDVLNIEKASVIGWSLGGMIVQNFALKYPDRVNKVVLINTNYGMPNEQGIVAFKNDRLKKLETLKEDPEKAFWDGAVLGFHRKFRKEMQQNPQKMFYDLWSVEGVIEESTIDPPTSNDIENQAKALETHNTFERLDNLTMPVLLLSASHDRLTPKSVMDEIHEKLPNSKLVVIDKAGHNSPQSRAPEVNQAIIEFLKE